MHAEIDFKFEMTLPAANYDNVELSASVTLRSECNTILICTRFDINLYSSPERNRFI